MMEKNPSDTRRHKRSHEIRKTMSQQGQIVQLKETDKKDRDRETEKYYIRNVLLMWSVNQEEDAKVSHKK